MEINTDDTETLNKALRLLVKISKAAGDLEGNLTLTELVARISRMREALEEILAEEMTDHKSLEEFGGFMLPDELRNKIKEALK